MLNTQELERIRLREYRRYGDAYPIMTFLKTREKTDIDGDLRTVMRPNERAKQLLKELETLDGDPQQLEADCHSMYTVFSKPALRFVREMIGMDKNVSISNIGAEFLPGAGIHLPMHTMFLYEIVDSDYRIHYLLSTSYVTLEAKARLLYQAEEIDYYDYDNMFADDGTMIISKGGVANFLSGLIQDHFDNDVFPFNFASISDLILLNPYTADFCLGSEEMYGDQLNRRFGIWAPTSIVIEPNF